MKRDFRVKVVDESGKGFLFTGKDGEVVEKTFATRIGIGDVKEEIHVKSFKIKKIGGKKK